MSAPLTDRAIAVGDLVQVVRGCKHCGDENDIGEIFKVSGFAKDNWPTDCCGDRTTEVIALDGNENGGGSPLYQVKRIPPLDEPAETYETDTLKEPA